MLMLIQPANPSIFSCYFVQSVLFTHPFYPTANLCVQCSGVDEINTPFYDQITVSIMPHTDIDIWNSSKKLIDSRNG